MKLRMMADRSPTREFAICCVIVWRQPAQPRRAHSINVSIHSTLFTRLDPHTHHVRFVCPRLSFLHMSFALNDRPRIVRLFDSR